MSGHPHRHPRAAVFSPHDAYKVKRAVAFPFMDFSTLEKRRAACLAEIAINRPNAPQLYLGVVPVTQEGGGLALGGDGPPVEWAVHMHRFDEAQTFDHLAARGQLDKGVLAALARAIAEAHGPAPPPAPPPSTRWPPSRRAQDNRESFARRRTSSIPRNRPPHRGHGPALQANANAPPRARAWRAETCAGAMATCTCATLRSLRTACPVRRIEFNPGPRHMRCAVRHRFPADDSGTGGCGRKPTRC